MCQTLEQDEDIAKKVKENHQIGKMSASISHLIPYNFDFKVENYMSDICYKNPTHLKLKMNFKSADR